MSISPNAQEKQFLKAVADFHNDYGVGYLFGSEFQYSPFQIHHVAGRAYKQNKVHIGHYFILPVPVVLHDVHSNHPCNVTHYRHNFTESYGNQRDLWDRMITKMGELGTFEEEVIPSPVYFSIVSTKY